MALAAVESWAEQTPHTGEKSRQKASSSESVFKTLSGSLRPFFLSPFPPGPPPWESSPRLDGT